MPVKCQRCGAENPAAARFCMSCGNALPDVDDAAAPESAVPTATAPPAAPIPEPVVRDEPGLSPLPAQFSRRPTDPGELPPTHPDWRMSPAGPLPDPPKRRVWLWVLGGIGAVILLCVVMLIISSLAVGPGLEAPAGP
ncbi:MAG: zinc ribbon domain-containing protein [Chloroflexota bacterium]|nr:zinc ribbon domain-containing protein [Chloroflexota bacterium]